MIRKGINFARLLKKYKKGWVGISHDFKRVLLYGKTLKATKEKAKKIDQKVFFFPSGEKYSHFVG